MKLRKAVVSYLSLALGCWLLSSLPLWAADQPSPHMTSDHAAAFAVSPPLRDLAKFPAAPYYSYHLAHEVRRTSIHPEHPYQPDAVEQNSPGAPANVTLGLNLLGLDNAQSCECQPPDTNAAVGDTQVVEWVNVAYEIFNKTTGSVEVGPIQGNLLWQSLGGACFQNNDGDIIVQWDRTAHRWLLAQNVFNGPPYYACVAVSTSNDATGSYYLYAFPLEPGFPRLSQVGYLAQRILSD